MQQFGALVQYNVQQLKYTVADLVMYAIRKRQKSQVSQNFTKNRKTTWP